MARKIMAGMLITISSILLLLSLAGIALTWIYKEPLKQEALTRLKAVDTELAQAHTALQNAQTELERTLRIAEAAEKTLATLKDELTQAKQLFGTVNGALDQELIPGLKASRDKINQAKSVILDLRATLERINSLPFVNLNIPGEQTLTDLIATTNAIDGQIARVEALTQKASTFMNDMSYLSGGDLSETKQNIQNFLVVVKGYDQKLTGWQTQVVGLIKSLPGWVDSAALVLTIFLLWFGCSQFSLCLHGLTLWRGGDPLAALRKSNEAEVQI
jgi:hypothetical protein